MQKEGRPTIDFNVSGAPFTETMYVVSLLDGDGLVPAITDIRFSALRKWKRWEICQRPARPLFGTTVSVRVTVQSNADKVAFSKGSPMISPSRFAKAWQVRSTCLTGEETSICDNGTGSSELRRETSNWVKLVRVKRETYSCIPATPSTTKSSLVSVPVLSKQQISTLPAKGIRNGSVQ